jgi:5-methylcytosine-specific restriction protein B
MAMYFTGEHFELLKTWQGKSRDETDEAQNQAYEKLSEAYDVTKAWADALQAKRFPNGRVSVRRRPTNQRNSFMPYNWAKIYPQPKASRFLAYTVGIENDEFVVKIDTVQQPEKSKVRIAYKALRGHVDGSPILASLAAERGLAMSLAELVDWSSAAIDGFKFTYDDVREKLQLPEEDITKKTSKTANANEDGDDEDDDGEEVEVDASTDSKRYPFNRIYYGPPGTGKTFRVQRLLTQDYEQMDVSEDARKQQAIDLFVETLSWWQVIAAAMYQLKGNVKVDQLIAHPFIKARAQANARTTGVPQTVWTCLGEHTIEESVTVKQKRRTDPRTFDKNPDSSWKLAGEWQEVCAELFVGVDALNKGVIPKNKIKRYEFVTFHQSYGYEDFVEGLRPLLANEEGDSDLKFEIRDGIFKKLCRRARTEPGYRFAIVIDEINRGNISKIFGDLISLIEPDKRQGAANELEVTLPYSQEKFTVPANLDIIGTMNTADRSLALIDTALRRRFDFVSMMPDTRDRNDAPLFELQISEGTHKIDVRRMLELINQRIEALYDRDHTIGHAYFTSLKGLVEEKRFADLREIFRNRIVPLLEEYFFDDWRKIRLVLGDNQKQDVSLQFVTATHFALDNLFGSARDLDEGTAPQRYQIEESAFDKPLAYIGIYLR